MAPHILVIDDQTSLSYFIAIELDAAGYRVSSGCNNWRDGTDCLSAIRAINPDLILLNWELRNASGPDLCRQLGREADPVPLVVVTAQESNCAIALSLGAATCLTKPFSISNLLNAIEVCLKSQAQEVQYSGG